MQKEAPLNSKTKQNIQGISYLSIRYQRHWNIQMKISERVNPVFFAVYSIILEPSCQILR